MSQSQLAAALRHITGMKMEKSLISQWENGGVHNPQNANLLAIQQVTGFSAEWLVKGRGPERVSARAGEAGILDAARLARAIAATGVAVPDGFVQTVGDLYDMLGDTPGITDEMLARFAATLLSRAR